MPTLSITITGKVQGVFFRQSTREKALELNLAGEVWNNPDGTVGIIVSGEKPAIDELVRWCHEGPPRARVQAVQVEDAEDRNFSGFSIVR